MAENGIPGTDFFQGNVEAGLEKMRRRLLDLSKRNRLLHWKATKRSSLLVVDELPNELFRQLVAGRELTFRPVPRPRGQNGEIIEGDQLVLDGGIARGTGSPIRRKVQSAIEHAAELGLATSVDLPLQPQAGLTSSRHTDREIQTLLYPEDLEAVLRSIRSTANLAIDETGSNLLYLVFGFMEWFESTSSQDVALAPLVLVPVSLERLAPERGSGLYRYAVRHSGEDLSVNVTLQELLKQDFGLDLPSLADDEEPEAYFERVGRLCAEGVDHRWCVRRRVALTMLSFGKMLIYRDLDSRNWPAGGGPAQHPRVREFFEGIQHESFETAADYDLDDPPAVLRAPLLVDEADSSQHSALLDALDGRNLVIQGPPGTGKSQTIANLIAAALDAGKTVLFVSEKLAALEVVRNRLDNVGLGHFCLELHSHKTQKRRVLEDLAARLRRKGSFPPVHSLDRFLELLTENKAVLGEYSALLNQPFGDSGNTLYDVLWAASARRRSLAIAPALLEGIELGDVARWPASARQGFRKAAEDFAAHCAAVSRTGPPRQHPWYGVDNPSLSFLDVPRVRSSLEHLASAASGVLSELEGLSADVGGAVCDATAESASALWACINGLPIPTVPIARVLLPHLRSKDTWTRLAAFDCDVARYRELMAKLASVGYDGRNLSSQQLSAATIGANHASNMLGSTCPIGEVAEVAHDASAALESVRIARGDLERLARLIAPLAIQPTADGLAFAATLLESLEGCPIELLALRHPGLNGLEARLALEFLAADIDDWKTQRAALEAEYDLGSVPSLETLQSHVRMVSQARWWSVFTLKYRRTRAAFRSLARTHRRQPRSVMLEGLRALMRMEECGEKLSQNRALRAACGPSWAGPDTPFDALRRLAGWIERLEQATAAYACGGSAAAPSLALASAQTLVALHQFTRTDTGRRAKVAIDAAVEVAEITDAVGVSDTWDALTQSLQVVRDELSEAASSLHAVALNSEVSLDRVPGIADSISELQRIAALTASDRALMRILGPDFKGVDTDLQLLASTMNLAKAITGARLPPAVEGWLFEAEDPKQHLEALRRVGVRLRTQTEEYASSWRETKLLLGLNGADWTTDPTEAESMSLPVVVQRSRQAIVHEADFAAWLDYARARRSAREIGLGRVILLCESGQLQARDCTNVAEYIWSDSLARDLIRTNPVLSRFSGISHEQTRKRFADLDRELMSVTRKRVASRADMRPVPVGQGTGRVKSWTELSLLKHEAAKATRHVPIRDLVARAGGALQGLKPCFMMGPLSVAQYIAPGRLSFDIVVMDEASQLKPEDAIGSVARGAQIVIVGDRMQLPPTTFFERIGEDIDEDEDQELITTGAESILDVAAMLYQPERMLRWHYRSRHPSLIAYSNHAFYDDELIIYPSPVATSHALGVKRVFVSSGRFEHHRNMVEAQRVVDTAIAFMRTRPTESLGIVALNVHQAALIEDLLEQRLKQEPSAQEYVASWQDTLEPVFVKNLENVQGDERDVIYISVTYGPSASGQVFQRFGPINGAFGHRRLNVLFTRSKHRTVVFSSLRSDQIQVSEASARGLKALRGYLEYAESGHIESAFPSGREPDSPFEVEVYQALKLRGLDVVAQVGMAGYFIDLAVRDRKRPGRFALGIECDGQTYHRSKCARDRDRLRQQILEGLGWRIHRIWSTDWFKNPEGEAERVLAAVEAAERAMTLADLPGDAVEETPPESEVAVVRETKAQYGWAGEETAQPLSSEEARTELGKLRSSLAAKYPRVPEEQHLLTQAMISRLLQQRPTSRADWFRRIPIELRMDIAEEHMTHLGEALQVVSRMGNSTSTPLI